MNKIKKTVSAVLMVIMVLTVFTGIANAYSQYHVTILGGLHGQVNGKDQIDVYVAPGGEWNPSDYTVTVTDDKYYFKGFHISGIEGTLEGRQVINEDRVFVATYGIKGDLVEYTVDYVDETGKPLAAKNVYYGNPGDKPVVAYRYIEGYLPQAYNITGTLKAEGPNGFTFVYTRLPEGTGGETTVIVYEPAGGGTSGGNAGTGGGTGNTGTSGNGGQGGTGNNGNGGQSGNVSTPEDIIDIDNPATPTAPGTSSGSETESSGGSSGSSGTGQNGGKAGGNGLLVGGGLAVAAAGIIAGVAAFLAKRKKKDKE